jgi:hypothetical protein
MLGVIPYWLFVGLKVGEHAARFNKSKRVTARILIRIHIIKNLTKCYAWGERTGRKRTGR